MAEQIKIQAAIIKNRKEKFLKNITIGEKRVCPIRFQLPRSQKLPQRNEYIE
jgi:hypothetical protein